MYTLGKKFSLVIKVKISIMFIIHVQEKSKSPKIFLWIRSIYINKKFVMIEIIQKIVGQKLTMLSLLI